MMLGRFKQINSVCVLMAKCLSLILSSIIICIKLAANWRAISCSDVLLIYPQGGFGHTIAGPDLVRRLFPEKTITVLFQFQRTVHNPLVRAIWPDLRLIFLPIEFAWSGRGGWTRLPWFVSLKSNWLFALMRVIFLEKIVLLYSDIFQMAHRYNSSSPDWVAGYFKLRDTIPAPPPRLPHALNRKVRKALSLHVPDHKKICCLYLRAKGDARDSDSTSWRRTGSPLRCYWKAIKALNERGYVVLLVGDRCLDEESMSALGSSVFDARSLSLAHDLLYLYAALESDIAVLECGGGTWLPALRGIPHLVVNVLPFRYASPGGTIYFKSVIRADGGPLDIGCLLGEKSESYEFPGCNVKENDEDELETAVLDFLDHLHEPRPWGVNAAALVELQRASFHCVVHSGISPVWLNQYGTIRLRTAAGR